MWWRQTERRRTILRSWSRIQPSQWTLVGLPSGQIWRCIFTARRVRSGLILCGTFWCAVRMRWCSWCRCIVRVIFSWRRRCCGICSFMRPKCRWWWWARTATFQTRGLWRRCCRRWGWARCSDSDFCHQCHTDARCGSGVDCAHWALSALGAGACAGWACASVGRGLWAGWVGRTRSKWRGQTSVCPLQFWCARAIRLRYEHVIQWQQASHSRCRAHILEWCGLKRTCPCLLHWGCSCASTVLDCSKFG